MASREERGSALASSKTPYISRYGAARCARSCGDRGDEAQINSAITSVVLGDFTKLGGGSPPEPLSQATADPRGEKVAKRKQVQGGQIRASFTTLSSRRTISASSVSSYVRF
jgi:hypothetical protein